MRIEYSRPVSLKVWFQGGSTSRNFDGVTLIEEVNGIMKISYKNKANMKKTAILYLANINMLEEL